MDESRAQKGGQSTSALLPPTRTSIASMSDLVARSSSFSEDGISKIVGVSGSKPKRGSPMDRREGDKPPPNRPLAHEEESSRVNEDADDAFKEARPREESDATDTVAGAKTAWGRPPMR